MDQKTNTKDTIKVIYAGISGFLMFGLFMVFMGRYGEVFDTELGRLLFIYFVGYSIIKFIFNDFKRVLRWIVDRIDKNQESEETSTAKEEFMDFEGGFDQLERIEKQQTRPTKSKLKLVLWSLLTLILGGVSVWFVVGGDGIVVTRFMFVIALLPIFTFFLGLFALELSNHHFNE